MLDSFLTNYFENNPIFYIDVGANTGQFFDSINKYLNIRTSFLIEPDYKAFATLIKKYEHFSHIQCFNMALGSFVGEIPFHINKYSLSNSILKADEKHEKYIDGKYLENDKIVETKINKLDNICSLQNFDTKGLIKIDTQGFEFEILKGSSLILASKLVEVFIIEVILVPIYQGQCRFEDIHEIMTQNGYYISEFYNKKKVDDIIHWMDVVYIKK